MGIVVLLLAGLALLVGIAVLPAVTTAVDSSGIAGVGAGTPLAPIIGLLGICFIGFIVIAVIWTVAKR